MNQNNPTGKRSGSNLQYFTYSNNDVSYIGTSPAVDITTAQYNNHRVIKYKDDDVDHIWFFGCPSNAALIDNNRPSYITRRTSGLSIDSNYKNGIIIDDNFYYYHNSSKISIMIFNLKTGGYTEKTINNNGGFSINNMFPCEDGKSLYLLTNANTANQILLVKYNIITGLFNSEFTTPSNSGVICGSYTTFRISFVKDDKLFIISSLLGSNGNKSVLVDLKTKEFKILNVAIATIDEIKTKCFFEDDIVYIINTSNGVIWTFDTISYTLGSYSNTDCYGSNYSCNSDFSIGTHVNHNLNFYFSKHPTRKRAYMMILQNNIIDASNVSNIISAIVQEGLLFVIFKDGVGLSVYNFYKYTKVVGANKGDIVSASKFLFDDYGNMYEPFVENIMIENSNLYCYIQPDNEVTGYIECNS